ncbi:muramoyltetrapeptide carboxypeptidase [Streptomyces sp. SLBN-118]|uniref:S66 peptidase family protein n=1 Tax=Streptomyces sp. SLBN-118 TaxID=2768454 RepID=UPI00114F3B4C|nr:S66 peptidase family protein [Streptomyces sp. SLBN-118]TQK45459.1 muramoyltetrapeptide carboxypeptidase [Streptomyces sp. SLBN-118]
MITWPSPLNDGATLAVWSPSSPAPVAFPRRFARGVEDLGSEGFTVRPLPSCGVARGVSTLEPVALAEELHRALLDPEIDGVMAAVGGWTLLNVLPHLDWQLIGEAGKPLIGYSDLTTLLNSVSRRSRLVAFHGPMLVSEWGEAGGAWDYTREEFRALTGGAGLRPGRPVAEPAEWSDELLWWDKEDTRPRAPRDGERIRTVRAGGGVEGTLWGGSLAVLSLALGTPYADPPEDALVFLEAEGLAPDEFAARLCQLRLAGVFDRAAGVLVSRIGGARACLSGFTGFDEVLRDLVPAHLPIAAGYPFGHSTPMLTVPVGGQARLDCATSGPPRLTLLAPTA